MTEKQLRQNLVSIFEGWIGLKEADGSHMKIVDIYNNHKPLARGYKVKKKDAWCATAASAAAIVAGLTDIIPTECGCGEQIKLWQQMGRWKENDGYIPQTGDYIYYDWDDTGNGDCTGWPEHVGVVVSVTGNSIKVIEGNKSDAVGYREIQVNGRYIRGYGLPDYASKATAEKELNPYPVPTRTIYYRKPIVLKGDDVKWVQWHLVQAGYDIEIDGKFGPASNKALRDYQSKHGLAVDGRCGPATRANMMAE